MTINAPPRLTIFSPQNRNYNTRNILINITNSSDTQSVWWYNGTANVTYTVLVWFNFSEGSNTLYVYANDSISQISTAGVVFFVDTIYPTINFTSPTETSGTTNTTRTNLLVNVTVNDTNLANITIKLYNSAGSLISLANSTTTSLFANFTELLNGIYYFNATVCDISNNCNNTETRNVTISQPITFKLPTPTNGTIINVNSIKINTITNDINFKNYTYYLYNSIGLVTKNKYPKEEVGLSVGEYFFTCFLKQNGSVQCQGYNTNGQSNNYTGTDVLQVSSGYYHTCFLKQNGSVQCQGGNAYGGANNYLGTDVIQVLCGHQHTCFLKENGSVQCQGKNWYGESNNYSGTDVIQISAGNYQTCFLKQNGSVQCQGANAQGQANNYLGTDVIQVSAGSGHNCFLKQNGSVQCQGYNSNGQSNPYNGIDVIQVSAGQTTTCFLKQNGSVQCQGSNPDTYLGTDVKKTAFYTFQNLSEGAYYINATSCTTLNNCNHTETRSVVINALPTLTIFSPQNRNYNTRNILINITNSSDAQSVWWYNGTANVTYTVPVWFNFSEGSNNFYVYVNDSISQIGTASVAFLVDTISPIINYISSNPADGASINSSSFSVYVNVTETNFANVTFYLFNSTRSLINESYFSELPYIYSAGSKLYIYVNDSLASAFWWGCSGTAIGAGAQSDTNGSGNTIAIVAGCAEASRAARLCSDLNSYGYDDWYLPAKDQLVTMYDQSNNVTKGDYAAQWINFAAAYYWSSTEYSSSPASYAWRVYFTSGVSSTKSKSTSYPVRCVRNDIGYYSKTYTNLSEGKYYYNVTTIDIVNNQNSTETRNITLDITAPNGTILNPQNATITNESWQNFTINVSDNTGLSNATLYLYNETDLYNQTTITLGGVTQATIGIFVYLVDGVYSWFWNVVDLANNLFTTQSAEGNRTITADADFPIIIIFFPSDDVTYNYHNQSLNFSITDTNLQSCWKRLNSGNNITINCNENTTVNSSSQGTIEGTNTIYLYANDTYGNTVSASVTFGVSTIKPTVNLINPANNIKLNYINNILFNFTATTPNTPDSCELWGNWTGIWSLNETFKGQAGNTTYKNISSGEGKYSWNIKCNDTLGNIGWAVVNNTFEIDITSPSINLTSPFNTTYNSIITRMNYTVSDTNLQSCWFYNGTANNTINCGTNITTNLSSSQGSNTWIVYANDSAGNTNSSSITFFIDSISPIISVLSPQNQIYNTSIIYFNATSNEPINSWIVDYNGTNKTISINTSLNVEEGSHHLLLYANDSAGNWGLNDSIYFSVDLCTPNLANITAAWTNISCLTGDKMNQTRNITQYDINSCGEIGNQTFIEYRASEFCDFCTPNLLNTTWSPWINTTCALTQMNQSQFKIQYDSNNCYSQTGLASDNATNVTYYNYQLVGPTYLNTSWSSWLNLSCLANNKMNQTRNLTQYDIYSCSANQTFFEYRTTESCDFCTPLLANITAAWTNISCLTGDKMNQTRNITQYDTNSCGEIENQTFIEYQSIEYCAFDTVYPTINFTNPTEISGVTLMTRNNIQINVTASDANLSNITIRLYNSTKSIVNSTNSATSPLFIEFTELSYDTYYFNATACDSSNNCNSTETRNVTILVSIVDISLPVNSTSFGNLTPGQQSVNLSGITIRNNGNVYVDIEVNATDLWSGTHFWPGINYLFKIGDAGKGNETNGAYGSNSLLTWTQMSSIKQTCIYSLNWSDERNTAALHLNVTVPSDESEGVKESKIYITAVES